MIGHTVVPNNYVDFWLTCRSIGDRDQGNFYHTGTNKERTMLHMLIADLVLQAAHHAPRQ